MNIGQPEIVDTTAALQLFLDALPSRNDAQRNFYVGLEANNLSGMETYCYITSY